MIKPVNGHLLIDPIQSEAFMASSHETYQEVGLIVASSWIGGENFPTSLLDEVPNVGDKVYFDSWLAAKYPKGALESDGYYWLVKWADVRAIEHVEPTLPE